MARASKASKKNEPQIYEHHDYRLFLKEWLKFKQSVQADFSLRLLAATLGVSPAYISYVLNGHRALTKPVLKKLLVLLKFSKDEIRYFNLLTVVADSDDSQERIKAFGEVQKFRKYRKLNPKETEVYRYMTRWYYVAIREMTALPDFKLEPAWIQKRLSFELSHKEILKTIRFLKRNDFIKVDDQGKVTMTQKKLECKGGVYRLALGQFHKQMYELASKSIDVVPRDERFIMSTTFAIPMGAFDLFKKSVEESFAKLSQMQNEQTQDPSAVYQIGFMGFPLAKKKSSGEAA